MDATKIVDLVVKRNEESERDTLREAEHIINAILHEQQKITCANKAIEELRKELTELQAEQVDVAEVLGGGQ